MKHCQKVRELETIDGWGHWHAIQLALKSNTPTSLYQLKKQQVWGRKSRNINSFNSFNDVLCLLGFMQAMLHLGVLWASDSQNLHRPRLPRLMPFPNVAVFSEWAAMPVTTTDRHETMKCSPYSNPLGMAVSLANVELGDSRSLLRHFWCLAQGNSALPRQPERRHSNTKRSSPKRITGVTAWHSFFWSEKMATQMLLKSRNTSIGAGKWTLQAQPLALQKTWHTALATPHQTTVNNPNTRNHQNLGVLFAKKKHYSTGRDSNWI